MPRRILSLAVLLVLASAAADAQPGAVRLRESLDLGWRFHRGDVPGAEAPAFDDSSWRRVDLPHDWSIEDLPADDPSRPPVLALVPGEWRFSPGDDAAWAAPAFDDGGWQAVTLPSAWADHGYTAENSLGWYRRRFDVPEAGRGRDVVLDLGRIDDADEAFVNGVRVGGRGALPPAWYDPMWSATWPFARFYRVPLTLVRGDGQDVVAVRVFGGPGRGGIYAASDSSGRVGPFDPALSPGGADTGHVLGGVGWYRRHLDRPAAWKGRRVSIEFEGVHRNGEVFVNGRSLGIRPCGYSTFVHDLTEWLHDGDNIIAVKVTNDGANSRWYTGSGLYRRVWLHVTGPVHVPHWGTLVTTPVVAADRASVVVSTLVRNEGARTVDARMHVRLFDPDDRLVAEGISASGVVLDGGETLLSATLDVPSPRRWSPDTPSMYRAEVEIVSSGRTADRQATPFGIRSITIDAGRGLRVNGTPLKLRGACVHHDNGPLGAAAFDRAEERRLELLKASGYNAVRTSHAPPSPAFLDAADRLGILVMDEAFDMWRREKRPDDYHLDFDAWGVRDLEAMVLRDRNHPSVFAWSIGNEIPERAEPEGRTLARTLASRVRALDPTRPVTAAVNEVRPWTDADGTFEALDLAGYNYLPQFYAADHDRVPSRAIVATESFPPAAFDSWMGVLDHPHVIGDFVWTGMDYLGESGIGHTWPENEPATFLLGFPWHVSGCGDLDLCGWKRPQSYYRDVLWRRGAPVYIAVTRPRGVESKVSHWGWPDVAASWNWGPQPDPLAVEVYTTAARIDLSLNGTPVGTAPASRVTKFMARFSVPWAAGTLRAVGFDEAGREVGWAELTTTGEAAAIVASADRAVMPADRHELVYVTVEVVDAQGRRVPDAERPLRFTVTGPVEIAGHASGNPADASSYQAPARTTFDGRALVVLRPTGGAGSATLRIDAEGLASTVVGLAVR